MSDVVKAVAALGRQKPGWAHTIILAGVRGSDAHGSKLPEGHPRATDDVDTFGVSVQPIDWYLGIQGYHSQARQSWDTAGERYDHLIHDVRKFFHLLTKGNPNVHCWLWANPEDIVTVTDAGRLILDAREMFLSRLCFNALAGYATAQMHKMDRKRYQGYQGKKRKLLVDELGYDVKHAAHCVRLLNMGIELARTGRMSTRRPEGEAATLREIKAGDWPYRRTERLCNHLWGEFRVAEAQSDLPETLDRERIAALLVEVIRISQTTEEPWNSRASTN